MALRKGKRGSLNGPNVAGTTGKNVASPAAITIAKTVNIAAPKVPLHDRTNK